MNKIFPFILAMLFSSGALAQSNPSPASWQGTRTAGHGITYQNTGQGVTIQDAGQKLAIFGQLGLGGNINYSGGVSPGTNWLNVQGSVSGTCTGSPATFNGPDCALNEINITSDAVSAPSISVAALKIVHMIGGSTAQGTFTGLSLQVDQYAATGNTTATPGGYIGSVITVQTNQTGCGTVSTPCGSIFGSNIVTKMGGLYWGQMVGEELDLASVTGSSVQDKIGIQLVQTNIDAVSGIRSNIGITLNNAQVAPGWDCGICFGAYSGFDPITQNTGTIIGTYPHAGTGTMGTVAYGIDFSKYTFATAFLKSNGFTVDGSGNVVAASYKAGASAGVSCSGSPTASFASVNGIVTHC